MPQNKRQKGKWAKGLCVSVCAFLDFTTDVGACRFYRMGIHLMANGKYQTQGWDWEEFKAGAEKVCPGPGPAVWRQRKQKYIPAERERCTALVDIFELFSACSTVQKVPVVFSRNEG